MNKRIVAAFILAGFFCVTHCIAEEGMRGMRPMPSSAQQEDPEWSGYGMNFEWYGDKKLIKKLNLDARQAEDLKGLADTAKSLSENEEELKDAEESIKRQIGLKKLIKYSGEKEDPDLKEIEALVDSLNARKSASYKTQIMLKTKLRLLLSERQRDTLNSYYKDKENEQKKKMKEQMESMGGRGGMGGPGGGRGGMGGGGMGGHGAGF